MTCIVGIEHPEGIVLGADSLSADPWGTCQIETHPKLFERSGYLWGFTDSWRMGQILRYVANPARYHGEAEPFEHLVTSVVPTVRQAFTDQGWTSKENERESGGLFLVGFAGQVFRIDRDFHVGRSDRGWTAIGSGDEAAMGALHAIDDQGMDPHARIHRALWAAAAIKTSVRAPFHVIGQEKPR